MTDPRAWRPTGLAWARGGVALEWLSPAGDVRASDLHLGARLSLEVGQDRRCTGLWWAGRRVPCAAQAALVPQALSGQCGSCAAIARSRSVATDTALDDPREFTVYLAHHGSVVKVGITATERGPARLLEQGALSSVILSAGTLLSARRCEALLTAALGLPQQVRTARKRAARFAPEPAARRAEELSALADRAGRLDWPDGQIRATPEPVDHSGTYGLPPAGITPDRQVAPLLPGTTIGGEVRCRIGRDFYLATSAGLVLVDTGLLEGWALSRADGDAQFTASTSPVREPAATEDQHEALF